MAPVRRVAGWSLLALASASPVVGLAFLLGDGDVTCDGGSPTVCAAGAAALVAYFQTLGTLLLLLAGILGLAAWGLLRRPAPPVDPA